MANNEKKGGVEAATPKFLVFLFESFNCHKKFCFENHFNYQWLANCSLVFEFDPTSLDESKFKFKPLVVFSLPIGVKIFGGILYPFPTSIAGAGCEFGTECEFGATQNSEFIGDAEEFCNFWVRLSLVRFSFSTAGAGKTNFWGLFRNEELYFWIASNSRRSNSDLLGGGGVLPDSWSSPADFGVKAGGGELVLFALFRR